MSEPPQPKHHLVPITDCAADAGEVTVYINDTIQWENRTARRVRLRLPRNILDTNQATEVIPAGETSGRYTIIRKSHLYDFECLGIKRIAPRTGTITVEG